MLKSLGSSLVQPHDRSLSDLLSSNPNFGLDVLISPLAGVLLTPIHTLPALLSDLLTFLPSVKHRLDRVYVVLVLPEQQGVDVWTVPVKTAVGKLRRGIAMLDLGGGPEDGEAEPTAVKVGWANQAELGRLIRGLALAEVDAGSGRGGEESWTGSFLEQSDSAEEEEDGDDRDEVSLPSLSLAHVWCPTGSRLKLLP